AIRPSGRLVEVLPPVGQDLREGVPARACVYPPRPLGGPKTKVEALTKLLKETSLREEKAIENLRATEYQVLTFSKRLKDYEDSELGLLRKENMGLKSHVNFL
ncbi:hypothetical protein A2U01_0070303, partial [Trifolium medium]|nr:hypothetical protein [Trifolium medium]